MKQTLKLQKGHGLKVTKNCKVKNVFLKSKKVKNSCRLTGNFYFKNKEILKSVIINLRIN